MTLLTAKPDSQTGISSNGVVAGTDYLFPRETSSVLTIDPKSNRSTLSIVFSPGPLTSLNFFTQPPLKTLSKDELEEWKRFQSQHTVPALNLTAKVDNNQPLVAVNTPPDQTKDGILVFDVNIRRR